jgi:hypothetical protein
VAAERGAEHVRVHASAVVDEHVVKPARILPTALFGLATLELIKAYRAAISLILSSGAKYSR